MGWWAAYGGSSDGTQRLTAALVCPVCVRLQVISIPECLSDSALLSFDVNECPSLLRMLDALSLGNTNPAVSCELSCVEQFAKVGLQSGELGTVQPISRLGGWQARQHARYTEHACMHGPPHC